MAVVYATESRVIRRVIIADTDEELQRATSGGIAAGEALLLVPSAEAPGPGALRTAVEQRIGAPTQSDRVVERDATGKVVAVWRGDPSLDSPRAGNFCELHDKADIGDIRLPDGTYQTDPLRLVTPEQEAANRLVWEAVNQVP